MKKLFFLSIFGVSASLSHVYSQYYPNQRSNARDELEMLRELANDIERERDKEANAQRQIYAYRESVLSEIRRNSNRLSSDNYSYLISKERNAWISVQQAMRNSQNYKTFYQTGYVVLENYKNQMLNLLYNYLN